MALGRETCPYCDIACAHTYIGIIGRGARAAPYKRLYSISSESGCFTDFTSRFVGQSVANPNVVECLIPQFEDESAQYANS